MTCIEEMTCFPDKPLDVFKFFEYQYGMPTVIFLAMLVGIIIVAIYLHTRSLAHLAVMTIYAFSVFSTMWLNDVFLAEQYHTVMYVIALAIASVITMMVLKLVKE
ncbi:hypothetical protein QIT55_gp13 [Nitrosopumilus spindle-shaped virus]|uniref:Uncharacterized protein n=1 Tax=Nitrosopumilus spindle-shaped virus 1 TaxID=2848002 RepID=A0A514K2Y7_9VIRU|nr:hypothetical protein QIT55_gp13 [Nitrosopumilus spindle-shaped virus]QDI73999.1 hypothetical protein [Nitrosopumilus spindle-shaped virus]